jgi:general secretion pathway protein F
VVGGPRRQILAAQFARMTGELVAGGAPLLAALRVTQECLDDPLAREVTGEIWTRVRAGSPLNQAISQHRLFPAELVQLVALGEEAGQLAEFLLKAADFLERRTERTLERMVALVEPAMIIAFGGIIALVALSLLQAIYGVNASAL